MPSVLDQKLKKVIFCRRKRYDIPILSYKPFFKINRQIPADIPDAFRSSGAPAQYGLYFLHNNLNPKRLCNIIVRSQAVAPYNLLIQVAGSQKDKWYTAGNNLIFRKPETVPVRQVYIQKDQIKGSF